MKKTSNPDQIRIQTLCAALDCCDAQLRRLVHTGKVPPADFYQHGRSSYWNLETIRAWRPDIAQKIQRLNKATA